MRDDVRRVRQYELMTIFSPDIPEESIQEEINRVGEIVSGAGGTVTLVNRESPWGRRRLAYPIRHGGRDVRDGYYVLQYLEVDSQAVAEIERDLKLMDNLMRYLLTQQVAEPMLPQSELDAAEEAAAAEAAAAGATGEAAPAEGEAPAAAEAPATAGSADEAATEAAATDAGAGEQTEPAAAPAETGNEAE